MYDTSKISIGELRMDDWLREEILGYIEKNPMVMDVDIYKHFKMRVDIIGGVLTDLRVEGEVERIMIGGRTHYRIHEITEEDFREVSLPIPFGTF